MRLNPRHTSVQGILNAWLTISVHCDAFLAEPRAYLTAAKWRILGKRVRARGQFAPLLSLSPKAYALWVLRQERSRTAHSLPDATLPIVALLDLRPGFDGALLADTMESLAAEGVRALSIGSEDVPTIDAAIARIDWSASPWLLPMAVGDRIARGAIADYRAAMRDPRVRLIYADDDLLVGSSRRTPHFKPDWNPELFAHCDYLFGACMVRATQAELQGLADVPDWAPRLIARIAQEQEPMHLHQMLHHRQARPMPALATPIELAGDLPPISVIVPTRNRVDLLRVCLDGLAATDYPDVEVIVVDNDSDDTETLDFLATLDRSRYRVLRHEGAFNYSAINNHAVAASCGALLCLLNNDIEVIEPDWLAIMATQALRAEVGAVGARLLYPDGRIQHAGVVIGVGNAAGHAHRFLRPEDEGYFHRHNLPQFTTAVTGACLVVERNKFLGAGGLNEQNFSVAFNDVDLCLRLNQHGWQSFYEPRATLIHHESVSRGLDQDPVGAARFAAELAALKLIWKTDEIFDAYHHPELSRASERYALAL